VKTFLSLTIIFMTSILSPVFSQEHFPDWAKGIVWYQIFPERFANGDTKNDPAAEKVFMNQKEIPQNWKVTKWTSNWFAESGWEKRAGGHFNSHLYERRYGGDLQGIIDHLDYLKELGIGAIYLNPIFEAVSLHKYDGSTYHHVDINFGPDPEGDKEIIKSEVPDDPSTWKWTSADKLFLKLIDEVHKRGMHIIIDGVFNHTGVQFWAFQDIIKNGKNSKYKDWYEIKSFDDPSTKKDEFDYKGWSNVKSLPQFNRTKNDLMPGPKQYIFHATQRWMDPNNDGDPSDGIDGWRLDVAREIPLGFWNDWHKLVKSVNPKAIIIGELWEFSPDFISKNGVFDGLMNYNFAFAVNSFFVAEKTKVPVSEFINKLKAIDKNYPEQNLYVLQNLVDSHDTERISSIIANPDRPFDRQGNSDNKNYNPGKPSKEDYEKQKLIAAFQMTYRGAPMIYYGDEVGMWGADDPYDRKPMVWDNLKYDDEVITRASGFRKGLGRYKVEQNKDLLEFYKKIISIHNNNKALMLGDVQFIYKNNDKASFAFERNYDDEKVIAVFNAGKEENDFDVPVDSQKVLFTELLSGEEGTAAGSSADLAKLHISIPPGKCLIYRIYRQK
jgi:cyclomaltodextrinase / maltogenic alpha-amylase / neopullulanase